jgi:hypothetical protein
MSAIKANERFIGMSAIEEHGEYYDDGSEWLPLSVWAARGFDAKCIELGAGPEDRRPHRLFGETFRVTILKSGHRGHKTASKTDTMRASTVAALPSGASSSGDGAPASLLAIGDKDSIGDKESSSSSSSSESSASRRRSKKSKKCKKNKKEKKESKKEKKEKKDKELKRKREAEEAKEAKDSVSSTASVGDYS